MERLTLQSLLKHGELPSGFPDLDLSVPLHRDPG